jgi:uncharacterized membrane protein
MWLRSLGPARWQWTMRVVLAAAWLAAVAFSIHFLLSVAGKYHAPNAAAYAMFQHRRGWLFAHLAGGTVTILLGPVQLMMRSVITSRRVHRWIGRVYLFGMLVACTAAIGLNLTSPAPSAIRVAFASTTLAWICTAVPGLLAIRRGDERAHRRWMVRTYLVTLAPVLFRVLLDLALRSGVAVSPGVIAGLLWASWALPLLVNETLGLLARWIRASAGRPALGATVSSQHR